MISGLLVSMGISRRDCLNGGVQEDQQKDGRTDASGDKVHLLFGHGVCKWPGCEAVCEDLQAFYK